MPAFLVHGVPDSHHVWDPLRAALGRADVVAPDLPRFAGAPAPDGFDCTKEAYAGWLAEQLEAVGEPVDLVGHDWGGILCLRVASTRPELIRTLAVGSGPLDETYVWHNTAQLWQTPEVGEQVMEAFGPELLVPVLEAEGFTAELATTEARLIDEPMKAAILALYRSAVDVGQEWTPALDGFPAGIKALTAARWGTSTAARMG